MQSNNPVQIDLFFEPKERLRATIAQDRSYLTVKVVWASPLTHPGKYLALLDGKGAEIIMLTDPGQLSASSRKAAESDLRCRYLTATVRRVFSARQEFAATYWRVETDCGDREFVTQNLQENAHWFSPTHLMLLDVDGNRFEIIDTEGWTRTVNG